MRERWLGATGRKVPEIVVEGELALPEDVLVLEVVDAKRCAGPSMQAGRSSCAPTLPKACGLALARPEVSCVLVPAEHRELTRLDLRTLTYG